MESLLCLAVFSNMSKVLGSLSSVVLGRRLLVDALANWHQSLRSVSALNFYLRGSRQRSWMPGLAKPDQGGKQEANGGKLAFIRAVQAFTCPADG